MTSRPLPSLKRTIETDVCVVGAGLNGLAHAHAARRRGLSVVVLERDPRALGGSVRHAGHLFFSALPVGGALDTPELARERWLELTGRAGAFVEEAGTVIVARRRDELAVLEAAAAERGPSTRMLTPDQVAALAPVARDGISGGFHGTRDLRVDPRSVTAGLARLLMRDPNARIEWNAPVREIEAGVVHAGQLRVRARAIVVCPGAGHRPLPTGLTAPTDELRRCRLQMLRVAAPPGRRYRPALATALSLLHLPVFASQPGAADLRARFELETPELVERGVQPLMVQLPGGDLIVGAAGAYEDVGTPFATERSYRLLLEEAQALLGVSPEIRQRWLVTAASLRDQNAARDFLVRAPLAGVRVVQSVSPLATALCHVNASEVLSQLLLEGASRGGPAPEYVVADRRKPAGLRAHPEAFRSQPALRS